MRGDAGWRQLAAAVLVAGVALRLWAATGSGYLGQDGDLFEWRLATHRALSRGLHTVYEDNRRNDPALTGREWTGGYFFNMPPVLLYLRALVARGYRSADPAGFELWDSSQNFHSLEQGDLGQRLARSRAFTLALKLPGIVADALIALAIYLLAAPRAPAVRVAALAAYALNFAVIYNTAFWGQGDAVWVVLLAASLLLSARGHAVAGAAAGALAGLTKPQALAFAPLVAVLLARRGWRTLAGAALAAAATALAVLLPFVLRGRLLETLELIGRSTFGGEPFFSCGAANLWLLVDGGRAFRSPDTLRLIGPLTARRLGLLAFVASALAIARRAAAQDSARPERLFLAASATSLAFFAFATELHENHLIAVLAFLPLAATADARLWWVLGALSLSIQANLVLFDPFALDRLQGVGVPSVGVREAAVAVALIQTAALPVVWRLYVVTRRRGLELDGARPPGSGDGPAAAPRTASPPRWLR
jgi:hypothetical protein